jgi:hypothetical protein
MKSFKTRCLILLLFVTISNFGRAQGTVIIQHWGYNDPTNEGFIPPGPNSGTGWQLFPVTNDLAMNAWAIIATNYSFPYYRYAFTIQQQSQFEVSDWVLSATFRMINNTGVALVRFDGFHFYVTNSAGYNTYQIFYNASAAAASYWINGTEVSSGLTGFGFADLQWGEYSPYPQTIQINWSAVSLEITPEPSSVALILLGGGVLIYVRKARRRARAGQIKGQVT